MSRPERLVSVGPIAFSFAGDSGLVRRIRFHDREILRGIYPAARDRDWGTLKPEIGTLKVAETSESLRLSLEGRVTAPAMNLVWSANVEADPAGRLRYHWRAKAMGDCVTNRTGLCVLYPAEIAGTPCVVEHLDGRCVAGWFPDRISPCQPFQDIRAIRHVVGRSSHVEVRMEGDVFEMEDQRNWTDASFKAYSRPLARPFPYSLAAGEELEQSVTVEVSGDKDSWPPMHSPGEVRRDRFTTRRPRIGFTLPNRLPATLRDRCRSLRPAHVRVVSHIVTLDQQLHWALEEAASLDCTLLLAIRGATDKPAERTRFPDHCLVHLFDENGNTVGKDVLTAWTRAGFSNLATGTLNHFAELNRYRPPVDGPHAYSVFGINAQVHASDDQSIQETLSQHAVVARAAHQLGGLRPVFVSPISLGRRADSVDPRLRTMFGARWLWDSLNQLSEAGCVEAVTYFHAHGPAGFLAEDRITPVEELLGELARCETLPPSFPLSE